MNPVVRDARTQIIDLILEKRAQAVDRAYDAQSAALALVNRLTEEAEKWLENYPGAEVMEYTDASLTLLLSPNERVRLEGARSAHGKANVFVSAEALVHGEFRYISRGELLRRCPGVNDIVKDLGF